MLIIILIIIIQRGENRANFSKMNKEWPENERKQGRKAELLFSSKDLNSLQAEDKK